MGSGGTTALLPPDKFFSNLPNFNLKSGADTQSRTGDLTLTKGALYQLSHISTLLTHWRKLLSFQWLSLCFFCESDQKTIIFRFIFISP